MLLTCMVNVGRGYIRGDAISAVWLKVEKRQFHMWLHLVYDSAGF
jgi:hypothetical protein